MIIMSRPNISTSRQRKQLDRWGLSLLTVPHSCTESLLNIFLPIVTHSHYLQLPLCSDCGVSGHEWGGVAKLEAALFGVNKQQWQHWSILIWPKTSKQCCQWANKPMNKQEKSQFFLAQNKTAVCSTFTFQFHFSQWDAEKKEAARHWGWLTKSKRRQFCVPAD